MEPTPIPAVGDRPFSGDRTPRGIAGELARRIRSGELTPGDRLPTVREVALDLGVSPATVSEAWQALRRAGLVVSRGRAGSFVREAPRPWLSPRMKGLVGNLEGKPIDLSRGTPDPDLLPPLEPALRRISPHAGTDFYQDAPILPDLRELLEASWPYATDVITVVDGAQDAVARTLEQVVSFGDRVAVESPGFPPFLDMLELLGAEVIPMELDEHGIRPESLDRALRQHPVVVIIQPRAQNPTGAAMTETRAAELAARLRRSGRGVTVIEDDQTWSISTAPDLSLGVWIPEQVVHIRGFSKSHGPDLRIAALGGPAALVDRIVARRMLGPAWTSRMLQKILLDLLTEDGSVASVALARRTYADRQKAMVTALANREIHVPVPDGINLWLPVADERAALLQLSTAGIRVARGTPFAAPGHDPGPHIRVTTGMVEPGAAGQVATALASAMHAAAGESQSRE